MAAADPLLEQVHKFKRKTEVWKAASLSPSNSRRTTDFSNQDLSAIYLNGSNLRELNFRGARLVGAQIVNSDATRADFRDADLTGAFVFATTLTDAKFSATTKLPFEKSLALTFGMVELP